MRPLTPQHFGEWINLLIPVTRWSIISVMKSSFSCRGISAASRILFFAIVQAMMPSSSCTEEFPFPAPEGHLRIVTWNIELLGVREPLRNDAQLQALAERINGFDAAAIALQEIFDEVTFEDLRSRLGENWVAMAGVSENVLLYDTNKVEMLEGGILSELSDSGDPYPRATLWQPVTGVFRKAGANAKPFRIIGIHCQWDNASVRAVEGDWLRLKTIEYLEDPRAVHEIVCLGDTNGTVRQSDGFMGAPNPQLSEGGYLSYLNKENGDVTFILGTRLDHIFVTEQMKPRLAKETCFVIRPSHYGETNTQFRETYSDHFPVFIDIEAGAIPQDTGTSDWPLYP